MFHNKTEIDAKDKICVSVDEKDLCVNDYRDSSKHQFRLFDYCYWSVDGFDTKPDGSYVPKNAKYSDQKKIYSEIGSKIVDQALKGFHSSLIAYGQTGTGKTYTLFGDENNLGVVSRMCEDLCHRLGQSKDMQVKI